MVVPERTRRTTTNEARLLARELSGQGWTVIELDDGLRDRHDLVQALSARLPLDPPIAGPLHSWDALLDSARAAMYELGPRPVALIWADPETMYREARSDYESAVRLLGDVTYVADRKEPGLPTEILVVLGDERSSRDIRER